MDIKRLAPYIVVLFGIIVMLADYTIVYNPLQELAKMFNHTVGVILNFSVIVGVVYQCYRHGKIVQERRKNWDSSIIVWVIFIIFLAVAAWQTSSGDVYRALYNGIIVPAHWASEGFIIFLFFSASYRGYRARSIESFFMVVLAVICLVAAAPATRALYGVVLSPLFNWLVGVLSTGVSRGLNITIFIGSIAFMVRAIVGKERITGGGD